MVVLGYVASINYVTDRYRDDTGAHLDFPVILLNIPAHDLWRDCVETFLLLPEQTTTIVRSSKIRKIDSTIFCVYILKLKAKTLYPKLDWFTITFGV